MSIQSVPSRRRLSSTAAMMCTRDMPESLMPPPIGLKNLVATTASRRRPASALPSMRSDSPSA